MPNRDMVHFSGSIDLADTRFGATKWFPEGMSPHLWWPDDHTWCEATDIDLTTTYLKTSMECADAALEALPATPDQKVTCTSDTAVSPGHVETQGRGQHTDPARPMPITTDADIGPDAQKHIRTSGEARSEVSECE
ncbi:hypothetical protein [Rhodococcus pseudokoreensis]|uniref:hypothetical protein n=1 Tax=Rhodococcus pseudokoreensis TaxID=2811421 RepID=UPI001F122A25|nr:hypothetical protein [Rhodococcus pseudokoreensis]